MSDISNRTKFRLLSCLEEVKNEVSGGDVLDKANALESAVKGASTDNAGPGDKKDNPFDKAASKDKALFDNKGQSSGN